MKTPAAVRDWLLEPENPSIRYRTLVELLGHDSKDSVVRAAKDAIPTSKPVASLFAKMHPDGYWLHRGQGASLRYAMSSSTHFVLCYLAELGMDRSDPRVSKAADRYLQLGFPWSTEQYQACLDFYNLRTFVMLGYREHPRVENYVAKLLSVRRLDGGYLCGRKGFTEKTKSCWRGTVKALTAFAAVPELWQTPRCRELVQYFLSRQVIFRRDDLSTPIRGAFASMRFPFVIEGSLLEPLVALSTMGYGKHPSLCRCWDILMEKRDRSGRFVLDAAPAAVFKPGPAGQANKWATFYAYLALTRREREPVETAT